MWTSHDGRKVFSRQRIRGKGVLLLFWDRGTRMRTLWIIAALLVAIAMPTTALADPAVTDTEHLSFELQTIAFTCDGHQIEVSMQVRIMVHHVMGQAYQSRVHVNYSNFSGYDPATGIGYHGNDAVNGAYIDGGGNGATHVISTSEQTLVSEGPAPNLLLHVETNVAIDPVTGDLLGFHYHAVAKCS